jgi:hypothetical protein
MYCLQALKVTKDESGQSLLEFAFSATVFLIFFFAVAEFGFLFFTKLTLQNAVRQAGRYAITGNCGTNGSNGSNCFGNGATNRLSQILQTVSYYSFGLHPTVTVSCIQGSCPGYAGLGGNNAGGPGDTVQIAAKYTWTPFLLPTFLSPYTFTVQSTFRNETFAPPAS